jgi:rhamnosyl/mannosyltransferase
MEGLDARLVIAGDGPKADEWKAVTRDLELQDRVFFLGEVTEQQKRVLYQACDLFILPSSQRSEAYGLVQLEAMASGRPVISTDLATGTSFVNRHEETGLVVAPRNPGALREAISGLIEDDALRIRLGHQARKRASEEFTVEKMVSRIDEIYRELLDSRVV